MSSSAVMACTRFWPDNILISDTGTTHIFTKFRSWAHKFARSFHVVILNQPRWQVSWGHHGAHLGPVGPRWAPCWPHESCYLGVDPVLTTLNGYQDISTNILHPLPLRHGATIIAEYMKQVALYLHLWLGPFRFCYNAIPRDTAFTTTIHRPDFQLTKDTLHLVHSISNIMRIVAN